MKIDHLSDEQIEKFRDRRLSGEELLDIDDHLSDCDACRDRAWNRLDAGGALSNLKSDIRNEVSPHVGYADLVRLIEHKEGAETDIALKHIEECSRCFQEVEDLRQFHVLVENTPKSPETEEKNPVTRPFWTAAPVWGAVAAAIMIAVLLSTTRGPRLPLISNAPETGQAAIQIPPEYAQIIDKTLAPGSAIPDQFTPLLRSRGVLRSAGPAQPVVPGWVDGPVGIAVLSDRPQFRWQAVQGAKSYTVAVYDSNYRKVVSSPALTTTEWTPETPLPRGTLLSWQVTVAAANSVLRFPVPPDPEAVFEVIPEDKAAELDSIRSRFPDAHLMTAVMYFNAGDWDDAAAELAKLPPNGPDAAQAAQLQNRLQTIQAKRH